MNIQTISLQDSTHVPIDECAAYEPAGSQQIRLRGVLQVYRNGGWQTCKDYPAGSTVWIYNQSPGAEVLRFVDNPSTPPCGQDDYRLRSWHSRKWNGVWHEGGAFTTDSRYWNN